MKRIIAILIMLGLLLSLGGCGKKKKEETGLLRIGVLEPMSGQYAAEGMRETLGVQYANNETSTIRLGGKTYRIELVIRDNGSDAQQSAAAAKELVDAGCAVVLGSYGAELCKAASDVFLAAGVPVIAADCDDPSVTQGNDHYFSIGALPELQGSVLASFAKKNLYAKTVYCLIQSGSEEDAALARKFRQTAEKLDMSVVLMEFPKNQADFTPYLAAAKENGAGVIFAPCALQYAQRLIEQTEVEEGKPVFLADSRWRDAEVLKALEEKELQVYVSTTYVEGANSQFDERFKAWLNESDEALKYNGGSDEVTPESVLGYDAYYTALTAAGMADSADQADILAILPRVTREGIAGSVSFDDAGGAVRNSMWIVKADASAPEWELTGKTRIG